MLRWFCTFYQSPQMDKWLHTCCIGTSKRIWTNCDTRSFSNFDAQQHPNRAFPNRGSIFNNDQFSVLHNILSIVGVLGTPCIYIQGVAGSHRQNDRLCREDHFYEETYTRKHVVPESCACLKLRAPHTGTSWPSINVRSWYDDLCRQPSLCRSNM